MNAPIKTNATATMQTFSYIEQKTKNADIARYILSFISPRADIDANTGGYYISCAYAGFYELATGPDALMHCGAKYIIYGAMSGGNHMIVKRIMTIAAGYGAEALVYAVGTGDIKCARMILSYARRDPAYFCAVAGGPPQPRGDDYRFLLILAIRQLSSSNIDPRHIRAAKLIAAEWRREGYPLFIAPFVIHHAAMRTVFDGICESAEE